MVESLFESLFDEFSPKLRQVFFEYVKLMEAEGKKVHFVWVKEEGWQTTPRLLVAPGDVLRFRRWLLAQEREQDAQDQDNGDVS